uniref:Uncharacterized protein n=1 Tax=Molossus molossus TaxID=27622 RepID=A0A7J8FSZ4_MOLMO|nr:hypothetical protein HJG59_008407 [Molossus molossus]
MCILDTEQLKRTFEESQGCPGNAARIGTETLTHTGYPMPSRVKCKFGSFETTWHSSLLSPLSGTPWCRSGGVLEGTRRLSSLSLFFPCLLPPPGRRPNSWAVPCSRASFLNLSAIDMGPDNSLLGGAVLCVFRMFSNTLDLHSLHAKSNTLVATGCLQTFQVSLGGGGGGQYHLVEKQWSRIISVEWFPPGDTLGTCRLSPWFGGTSEPFRTRTLSSFKAEGPSPPRE